MSTPPAASPARPNATNATDATNAPNVTNANNAANAANANNAANAPNVMQTRHNLGRWSRRVVRALAEVVLPFGDGAPTVDAEEIVEFVDAYVHHLPRLFRALFPVGLMLLELGAFVLGPSLVPFSAMSRARRLRYVQSWIDAPWRLRRDLIKAVKGLVLIKYYSDPRVQAYLGYRPEEHVALVSAERLVRHADDLR